MYADPKLRDAFIKAIKHYFDDNDLEEYNKVVGERKFNKKYFDTLENDMTGEKTEVEKKPKKKSKTPSNKSNSLRVK